ncbi:MAG: hypothetical protein A2186_00950 [Candidatus Levybacteria bacterium RIFOXYA1_FULL_41_10]|nr:MAG: hypothetical protein UT44_C0012G0002 [Candidatus Levybacteria bacterium GW2011_GWA1_39_32]OGH21202.1 MAG: hypothetical protein A2695_03105 [Candidatus Levybacteria bacterium RIFCSPHIGHO2_01_FULL_40_83]OGH27034.1 MAG: hypothetical protein A3D82_02270 [Candidatus Levybacteria bacterium RIFCSPHIGHO2_02_FULL_40_29]OGH32821.1 MAG: hypothetical protein A3E70_02385 [Candidatus Levybacteria bacterium RIFCSPHIGHO2_12_FULL_40_44]OGH42143.1 MAG: hypothetical protein A2965_00905 [Candidatus Levybac
MNPETKARIQGFREGIWRTEYRALPNTGKVRKTLVLLDTFPIPLARSRSPQSENQAGVSR